MCDSQLNEGEVIFPKSKAPTVDIVKTVVMPSISAWSAEHGFDCLRLTSDKFVNAIFNLFAQKAGKKRGKYFRNTSDVSHVEMVKKDFPEWLANNIDIIKALITEDQKQIDFQKAKAIACIEKNPISSSSLQALQLHNSYALNNTFNHEPKGASKREREEVDEIAFRVANDCKKVKIGNALSSPTTLPLNPIDETMNKLLTATPHDVHLVKDFAKDVNVFCERAKSEMGKSEFVENLFFRLNQQQELLEFRRKIIEQSISKIRKELQSINESQERLTKEFYQTLLQ